MGKMVNRKLGEPRQCCMNVSNVFYDGWECFNETLPCLLLANRPHRGTPGGHREKREERTNIIGSQAVIPDMLGNPSKEKIEKKGNVSDASHVYEASSIIFSLKKSKYLQLL